MPEAGGVNGHQSDMNLDKLMYLGLSHTTAFIRAHSFEYSEAIYTAFELTPSLLET